MAFNKYTQITPAKYDARSLQETLYLPTLKRKQHDAMDQKLATTKSALDQYDSLDFQSELVNKEKEKLNKRIEDQASMLANQGFKSNSKTDFLNLASDFSESTSVNGKIGKAKQIKDNYLANRSRIIQNAVKQGYSGDDAKRFVDKQFEEYKNNWDGENLNQIDLYDAPKYMTIENEFSRLVKDMGSTTIQKIKNKGYKIAEENGHFVYKTPTGSTVKVDNDKQLNFALALLNNEFLVEGSKGKQSLDVQGISGEEAAGKISNLMGLSQKEVVKDTEALNYRFAKNVLNTTRGSGNSSSNISLGTNYTSSTPISFDVENINDLRAKSEIKEGFTKEEIKESRKYQKLLKSVETVTNDNAEFNATNEEIQKVKNKANEIPEKYQEIFSQVSTSGIISGTRSKKENEILDEFFTKEFGSFKEGIRNEKFREYAVEAYQLENNINELESKKEEIYNSVMTEAVVDNVEYKLLDETKDRKERNSLVGLILGGKKNSNITGMELINSEDEVENINIQKNQELINALRRDLNGEGLKDSEVIDTSLIKNDLQSGIKVTMRFGEDDVDSGVYSEYEAGDRINMVISAEDFENGNMPTVMSQYIDKTYGQKGVKQFKSIAFDKKYPSTANKEDLGSGGIPEEQIFFNANNDSKLDFLSETKKVGNKTINYETPYLISDEEDGKTPLTFGKFVDKIKNSSFDETDPQFIQFVSVLHDDMINLGVDKSLGETKFAKKYFENLGNGTSKLNKKQFDNLLESLEDYPIIFKDNSNKYRMSKLAQKYKNL